MEEISVVVDVCLWGKKVGEDFTPLSEMTSTKTENVKAGTTVREVLEHLARQYPSIAEAIFDTQEKKVYPHILLYFNEKVISPLTVYDRVLKDGDKITVLPLVTGG